MASQGGEETLEVQELRQQVMAAIVNNDLNTFKSAVSQLTGGLEFSDVNGMTPLHLACLKGNKEAFDILMILGADVNSVQTTGAACNPLHCASITGNVEIGQGLLQAGAHRKALDAFSNTPVKLAVLHDNFSFANLVVNYVPVGELQRYTGAHGEQAEPIFPAALMQSFYKFVLHPNLHPVSMVLNLEALDLLDNLKGLHQALRMMCKRELDKAGNADAELAFKWHYMHWLVDELICCEQNDEAAAAAAAAAEDAGLRKRKFVDKFIKRTLKLKHLGLLGYADKIKIDMAAGFLPTEDKSPFKKLVEAITPTFDGQPILLLEDVFYGYSSHMPNDQRCGACDQGDAYSKCSNCKSVYYCTINCQRLHWAVHKRNCQPLAASDPSTQ